MYSEPCQTSKMKAFEYTSTIDDNINGRGVFKTSTIYIIINVVNMTDQLSNDNVLETKKTKQQ